MWRRGWEREKRGRDYNSMEKRRERKDKRDERKKSKGRTDNRHFLLRLKGGQGKQKETQKESSRVDSE